MVYSRKKGFTQEMQAVYGHAMAQGIKHLECLICEKGHAREQICLVRS